MIASILLFLSGDVDVATATAVAQLALTSQVVASVKPEPAYDAAFRLAKARQSPLVVFVDLPCRDVPGCVAVSDASLYSDSTRRVVVSRWVNGVLMWVKDLPAVAADEDILEVLSAGVSAPSVLVRGPVARTC